ECAGDRGRHRRRQGARRLCARRTDHARLQRTRPVGPRLRGAHRDAVRPVGARRSLAQLLDRAIAQFRTRPRARARRSSAGRQACRRRVHRSGAVRARRCAEGRYAGVERGRRDPERPADDRCGDRRIADTAFQGRVARVTGARGGASRSARAVLAWRRTVGSRS
ncbi:hypothetical protein chiPu_0033550, partial [Chiloscyllium punctatum]|nr:hypothetical protein [Chiloscyllium punctatum]